MKLAVPKEVAPAEKRVAATPDTVEKLIGMGFDVTVEAGAGIAADFPDELYVAAGATLEADARKLWSEADLVIKVNPPGLNEALGIDEVDLLRKGGAMISLLYPAQNEALVQQLAARDATVLALDAVPRISRAQKMDVLSSMANIAGYRAVLEAAHRYGRFFGGQITAAGKTRPARVLVIGAGVAGLAAIAAAKGLGAEVRAFDVRPSVEEQVKSLGAAFLKVQLEESGEGTGGYAKEMSPEFIDAEMALFRKQCTEVDIIVTTALIPGRPAPKLILTDMVEVMQPGSVIVDLAAPTGGNCDLTVKDQIVTHDGVTIIGYTDLTSRLPSHASQFFGTNLANLLEEMGGGEGWNVDLEDEAVRGALVAYEGEVMWPPPKKAEPVKRPTATLPAAEPKPAPEPKVDPAKQGRNSAIMAITSALLIAAVGQFTPADFIQHFTVFVLAVFIGYQVVWNVTPALHTPLMSVTNAISGIIIVGGLLQAGLSSTTELAVILGAIAILVATINIAGGFYVTQRMLRMFHK